MNCRSYIMLKCEITAIEVGEKGYYPDVHIKELNSQSEKTVSRPRCGRETCQKINSATSKPGITVHI